MIIMTEKYNKVFRLGLKEVEFMVDVLRWFEILSNIG